MKNLNQFNLKKIILERYKDSHHPVNNDVGVAQIINNAAFDIAQVIKENEKEFKPNTTCLNNCEINHFRPMHPQINNWVFSGHEANRDSDNAQLEANLADALMRVASSNNVSVHEVNSLFPAILRMLKSTSSWAK